MPDGHPHPGQQLADAKRFRQVVVGPGIQRRDLRFFPVADRQDDDRGLGPLPEPFCDVDAIEVRESEIEDDDVEAVRRCRGPMASCY
jgi:hypothetical protein